MFFSFPTLSRIAILGVPLDLQCQWNAEPGHLKYWRFDDVDGAGSSSHARKEHLCIAAMSSWRWHETMA